LTLGGLELATIMGGAIVTETIFGLDGVGRMAIAAALEADFPVVIGTTIFAASAFIITTLAVDLVAQWRDPANRN
jgi:peptide/nickel transport system permease protein